MLTASSTRSGCSTNESDVPRASMQCLRTEPQLPPLLSPELLPGSSSAGYDGDLQQVRREPPIDRCLRGVSCASGTACAPCTASGRCASSARWPAVRESLSAVWSTRSCSFASLSSRDGIAGAGGAAPSVVRSLRLAKTK
eukprot:scaffold2853_cov123-Isochrysis_galbana.AAC.2